MWLSNRKGAIYGPRTIQPTVLFCKLLPNHLHPINLCQNVLAPFAGGRLFAGCSPTCIPERGFGVISLLYCFVWRGRTFVNAPYQVPYKLKAASAALLHCFFGFLTTSGNFSDHGSRSSKNDRSLSSMCLGISVRRCSKYSYGFRLFAFAVSAML